MSDFGDDGKPVSVSPVGKVPISGTFTANPTCALCGKVATGGHWPEGKDIRVDVVLWHDEPDGGDGVALDVCPTCFRTKILTLKRT